MKSRSTYLSGYVSNDERPPGALSTISMGILQAAEAFDSVRLVTPLVIRVLLVVVVPGSIL